MVIQWVGIDIGSRSVGFAVVEGKGPLFTLLRCEAVALGEKPLSERVALLHAWLTPRLAEWPQAGVALEEPFAGKSIQSALVLGTIKGMVWGILLAQQRPSPQFLPAVAVKKALTGRGHAPKAQVAAMLQHHLRPPYTLPENDHATDAVAIAIAAALSQNSPITRTFKSRAER